MRYVKIPKSYKVGGQLMEVRNVERCDDNTVGACVLAGGYIEIADKFSREETQSQTSKENTFYHEMIHSILRTMGEDELNNNEKFVCCFAGFLNEAMGKAYFMEED